MKLLFIAVFASGLSMATLNSNINFAPMTPVLEECDIRRENSKQPKQYYPKKVCNIDNSSIDKYEKLSDFIIECTKSKGGWLLINLSEANYSNEILH